MARTRSHSDGISRGAVSRRWTKPALVSAAALMAGALAPASAQAECSGDGNQSYFPFGSGSGVNALTSVISTTNTAFMNNGSAFVTAPGAAPNQQGGGAWGRTIGGSVTTKADSSFNGTWFNPFPPDPGQKTAEGACRTEVEQDFAGFQVGHDIALLNMGNSGLNWHIGALAGYVQANFRDKTPGGTLTGNFNVPSAGVYTAISKGNLFADVQGRFDYFQGELSDPNANNIWDQRLDARGYSVSGNVGYRLDLGGNWAMEPSIGGVISHTEIDPFDVAGVIDLPGPEDPSPPTVKSFPGRVQMNSVNSELGRATLKVGTSVASRDGKVVAYPFASASLFHEFADDVTASFSGGGTAWRGVGSLTSDRIGAYALFSAGSAFVLTDTGWMGYARVDYRTGEKIDGYTVNAGVRYQFSPATASASLKDGGHSTDDLVEKYSWTGPYIGGFAGGTAGHAEWISDRFPVDVDNAGYLVGGQIGYNLQLGPVVLGVEAQNGFSNAQGARSCSTWNPMLGCENDVESLGSVSGRVGIAWNRALFYGKGGWAFGEVGVSGHINDPQMTEYYEPTSTSQWQSGWTAGGGVEFALTDRLSAKAEYMHYEFPGATFSVQNGLENTVAFNGDYVIIGLNYHVGGKAH